MLEAHKLIAKKEYAQSALENLFSARNLILSVIDFKGSKDILAEILFIIGGSLMAVIREIRENAMSSKTSVDRRKYGYQALSLLEKAEKILSSCQAQQLLCQIYSEEGIVYMDLLEDLNAAEKKFLQVFTISPPGSSWPEASKRLSQIAQKANRKPPSLEEVLLQIKTKRNEGTISLIEFVLKNHPPKHASAFDPKDWESPIQKVNMKILLKLVILYHTDKVDRSKFGEDYFLIVEDIAKCFGEALARIKDGL
jgi:hypothetical protein